MVLDETACRYGLLHIVFADAVEHLAGILFYLRREKESALQFEDVLQLRLKDQLDGLHKELQRFDARFSVQENAEAIRVACADMKKLSVWRNNRIHARVRMEDGGYALFNGKTGERLSISYKECDEIIRQLIKVIVMVGAHAPHLLNLLDFDKSLVELFRDVDDSQLEPEGAS